MRPLGGMLSGFAMVIWSGFPPPQPRTESRAVDTNRNNALLFTLKPPFLDSVERQTYLATVSICKYNGWIIHGPWVLGKIFGVIWINITGPAEDCPDVGGGGAAPPAKDGGQV